MIISGIETTLLVSGGAASAASRCPCVGRPSEAQLAGNGRITAVVDSVSGGFVQSSYGSWGEVFIPYPSTSLSIRARYIRVAQITL